VHAGDEKFIPNIYLKIHGQTCKHKMVENRLINGSSIVCVCVCGRARVFVRAL
jgi:hypothetical protein